MNDFCDCSQCPHHCGGNDEVDAPVDGNNGATTTSDSDKSDEGEVSDDEDTSSFAKASADETASAIEKVDHLKKDIIELGFKLEDTDDGIRVTM